MNGDIMDIETLILSETKYPISAPISKVASDGCVIEVEYAPLDNVVVCVPQEALRCPEIYFSPLVCADDAIPIKSVIDKKIIFFILLCFSIDIANIAKNQRFLGCHTIIFLQVTN